MTTGTILPIVLPAPRVKGADALVYLDGRSAYGQFLAEDALNVFNDQRAKRRLQARHGQIADSYWAAIKALLLLIQAIPKPGPRILSDYASWQATAVARAEKELADRLVSVLKSGAAQKVLSVIPSAVEKMRERTYSEDKVEFEGRVLSASPLAVVSELLLQINSMVRNARFVMFFDFSKKRPSPGLYCPDLGTGLAALVFSCVPTPKGLGVCRRAACSRNFLRVKARQQYCSLRCGNADRKARERSRKGRS